jgi:hypothetical protein
MKLIQFSSQNGSTQAGNLMRPFQLKLNELFFSEDGVDNQLCSISFLSIVFRVSGRNKDFGSEGAERLQKSRGRKVITIDLVIPQACWEHHNLNDFGVYLSDGISICFNLLKIRATELDPKINIDELDQYFQSSFDKFNDYVNNL